MRLACVALLAVTAGCNCSVQIPAPDGGGGGATGAGGGALGGGTAGSGGGGNPDGGCLDSQLECLNACRDCPLGATATSCGGFIGDTCIATACDSSFKLCDGTCS